MRVTFLKWLVVPMLLVWVVLAVLSGMFGAWMWAAAPFVELSVEAVPPGGATFVLFTREEVGLRTWHPWQAELMAHSRSYTDPRAIKAVGEWLERRCHDEHPMSPFDP